MKKEQNTKFAILIPARDESKVIAQLLKSIQSQTQKIDMQDVYVVIEQETDPTNEIAKHYGATVFVRKHLELKRKGYALDEVMKDMIGKGKHYDAYIIFDADNVADPHFLEEMEKSYREGYDVAIGYRNCRNGNDNVIAAASALSFCFLNLLGNKRRVKEGKSVLISGTGFYIRGSILEELGGFPFHSLTEDYEMSLYLCLHNLTSAYNEHAIFYDEQPTTFRTTVIQRTRWVRGFFDARKEYLPKIKELPKKKRTKSQRAALIGIKPYATLLIIAGMMLLVSLACFCYHLLQGSSVVSDLIAAGSVLLFVYLVLLILTLVMFLFDSKLDLNFKTKVKVLFYSPFFMLSYLICLMKAFTQKEIGWQKIEHTKN